MVSPVTAPMNCRAGCAACCVAPSISSPVPGRDGAPAAPKPAGQACVQLDEQLRCRLFGRADRPAVCRSLRPQPEMCGATAAEALQILTRLERQTQPA